MTKKTRKVKLAEGIAYLRDVFNERDKSLPIYFWGIDPSLSRSGICIVDADGEKKFLAGVDRVHRPENKNVTRTRYQQCHYMRLVINQLVKHYPPTLIISESYAHAARNITPVAEFNGAWRYLLLYQHETPELTAAPTQLRKFLFGKGTGQDKDYVSTFVMKEFGVECKNSDEADAFVLSLIGQAIYAYIFDIELEMNRTEIEVVETIIAEKHLLAKEW